MAEKEAENTNVLVNSEIHETYRKLDQVDEQERIRWRAALAIVGLLCLIVIALSPAIAAHHQGWSFVTLLLTFALAAIFVIFGFRPQMRMMQSRRELASQLGVAAALETLRLITGDSAAAAIERRRLGRASCDLGLTVITGEGNSASTYYGRMRDICEHGMGAIVPAALIVGERARLSFMLQDKTMMSVEATVRQRHAFRYGFEFSTLTSEQCEIIERLWLGGAEVAGAAAVADR